MEVKQTIEEAEKYGRERLDYHQKTWGKKYNKIEIHEWWIDGYKNVERFVKIV